MRPFLSHRNSLHSQEDGKLLVLPHEFFCGDIACFAANSFQIVRPAEHLFVKSEPEDQHL
jgi:hypothetical protein